MNRNAYEEQSLADIRGIRSQFSTNFYGTSAQVNEQGSS